MTSSIHNITHAASPSYFSRFRLFADASPHWGQTASIITSDYGITDGTLSPASMAVVSTSASGHYFASLKRHEIPSVCTVGEPTVAHYCQLFADVGKGDSLDPLHVQIRIGTHGEPPILPWTFRRYNSEPIPVPELYR